MANFSRTCMMASLDQADSQPRTRKYTQKPTISTQLAFNIVIRKSDIGIQQTQQHFHQPYYIILNLHGSANAAKNKQSTRFKNLIKGGTRGDKCMHFGGFFAVTRVEFEFCKSCIPTLCTRSNYMHEACVLACRVHCESFNSEVQCWNKKKMFVRVHECVDLLTQTNIKNNIQGNKDISNLQNYNPSLDVAMVCCHPNHQDVN